MKSNRNKLVSLVLLATSIIAFAPRLYSQCDLMIDVPEDITVCEPELVDLTGSISGSYLYFEWIGSNGFSDDQLITNDFPSANTTYTLNAYGQTSINLVVNGDFSAGNTGFSTDYSLGEVFCTNSPWGILGCEAMYTINTNAANTHTSFQPCTDHTTGFGNMMVVNGSANALNIWCQDINVTPNTEYIFSAWATSVVSSSPAILQFSINGTLIGSNFNLTSTTCLWENFTEVWSSEASTSATICITNQNLNVGGNDFALDDIEFIELCEDEASFDVTISEVLGTLPTSNSLNCDNPLIDLVVSPADPFYMYEWEAQFGGNIIGSTTSSSALGNSSGLYSVTITDSNGCTKKLTTTINGSSNPPAATVLGDFTLTCENNEVFLFSSNTDSGNTYYWEGSADNSQTGFAVYDTPGIYYLEITNSFNCTTIVPFGITDNIITPDYNLPPPNILSCIGDSTELIFNTANPPSSIEWFDPSGSALGSTDTLVVSDIGYYVVELEYANGCTFYDSVLVISQTSTLDYFFGESPLISCANSIDSISVTVNSPFSQIIWYQDTILGNDASLPIQEPGLYQVDIIDENGCITRDSISVVGDFEVNPYTLSTDDIDCIDGEGIVAIASDSLINVSWTLPGGGTSILDSIESSTSGLYIVEITHDNGCTELDSIELLANQNFPTISLIADSISCMSTSANIQIQSNIDSTSFEWVGPNGFTSTEEALTVDQAGYYVYTATTKEGCTSIDSVLITEDLEEPNFTLVSDTINCFQNEASISVSGDSGISIQNVDGSGNIDIDNLTIHVDEASNYVIIVEASNGCTSSQTIDVPSDFSAPAVIGLSDITLNCFTPDSTLLVNVPQDVVSYWTIGLDTVWNNSIDLNVDASQYELHLVNPNTGCSTTEGITVSQDFTVYPFDVSNTDISCNNLEATISIDVSESYLEIIGENGLNQVSETEFSTNSVLTGDITIIFENGCEGTESFNIAVDTIAPIISAEDKGFSCTKEPLALFVDVNIADPTYDWIGPQGINSTDDFLVTAIPGLYYVTVTDPTNGCSSSTEIEVFEFLNNLMYDVELEQPLCYGENGMIDIIDISGWTEPYEVNVYNTANQVVTASDVEPGDYTIVLEDSAGCDSSFTVNIVAPVQIDLQLVSEVTIGSGNDLQLDAFTNLDESDIATIEWTPSTNLSCDDCLNPFVSGLTEDTEFIITIVDNNGCVATQSVIVRVVIDYKIYSPNIFTPDENGINDVFYLNSNAFAAESVISEFAIFDRWGNKVFQRNEIQPNDPSEGWDGTFNNQPVKAGVYVWYAIVQLPDDTEELLKGDITIMR